MKILCWEGVVLSSPELKAQVSISDGLLSVLRLSINFSHYHLLLENHCVNFNQTWNKTSLGNSSLLK